jgi:hypothetical protein
MFDQRDVVVHCPMPASNTIQRGIWCVIWSKSEPIWAWTNGLCLGGVGARRYR